MVIVIDNYDSFTYNLVQYLGELGAQVQVFRNDAVTLEEIEKLGPSHIVISPGPGTPEEGGVSSAVICHFYRRVPILGVCLGHQCIGHVFGGVVERASRLMHGKTSAIYHIGRGIFADLPNPLVATRYHSLILKEPLPPPLKLTAFTSEGEIMGIQHQAYPVFGVQFHPESILTQDGKRLLENFLQIRR